MAGKKVQQSSGKSMVAARAGIWYVICSFINKGIAFLTTPIFTRILTKTEVGEFSNYSVWLSIITIIATMDMQVTVARARFDFDGQLDEYVSSLAILSSISTCIAYIAMLIFRGPVMKVTGLSPRMIHFLMATVLFTGAFNLFQVKQQVQYKYKTFAFITLLLNGASVLLSLFFVFHMEDRLGGRLIGFTIPRVLIYTTLFVILLFTGRSFQWKYCRYALAISLPYVPHLLSLNLLSTSDRTMIRNICGAEDAAVYTIGYSCAILVNVLSSSMNQSWIPWMSERLHKEDYAATRKWSAVYIGLFVVLVSCIGLVAPELILFMGGRSYADAVHVMPPIMAGCTFQAFYTLYVNVETYEKKTAGMAVATVTGAGINILLNAIFIPIYGFVAAAYTTLIGYAVLLAIHYLMVRRIHMTKVYDTKRFLMMLAAVTAMIPVYYLLYAHRYVRYAVIAGVVLGAMALCVKYKDTLLKFAKAFRRK